MQSLLLLTSSSATAGAFYSIEIINLVRDLRVSGSLLRRLVAYAVARFSSRSDQGVAFYCIETEIFT
jgi:hypothetical protein